MTDAPAPVVSILPPNATPAEKAIEGAAARLGAVPTPIREVWQPYSCPLEILPWLAWGLGVQGWDPTWPEATQRAVVANAVPTARRMGTVQAVRDAVANFGGAVALKEWWQTDPPGEPRTFQLVMQINGQDGAEVPASIIDAAIAEVTRVKPVSAQFTFTQGLGASGGVGVAAAARPAVFARVQSGF